MPTLTQKQKVLLACFFLSGLCGLVYQIVWMRLIGRVFGNSVFATATVLAAFMAGLALGSYWGGRLADRRRDQARLYGILEVCIGAYCILFPFLLALAEPFYASLYQRYGGTSALLNVSRAFICGVLILFPTTCMGATLPLLVRHFVKETRGLGQRVSLVYAVNTFGAVAGCVLAGFVLIPRLGLSWTTGLGVCVNIAVGIVAIAFLETERGKGADPGQVEDTRGPRGEDREATAMFTPREARMVLLAFGLSGFVAMVYEVALTRTFTLLIGSSTYAFSLMLTAFICGIGLGSLILGRWVTAERDLVLGVGLTQAGIGLSSIFMVGLIGEMPRRVVAAIGRFQSFESLQLAEFTYLFLLMVVPTALMGVMFPLTAAVWTRSADRVGRSSGEAYFVNTLGAILGSLAGGFVLLPLLGSLTMMGVQRSILYGALVNVAVGAAVLLNASRSPAPTRFLRAGVVLAAGLLLFLLTPRWDPEEFTSGIYLHAADEVRRGRGAAASVIDGITESQGQLIYNKDGPAGTVTVKQDGSGAYILRVNGKVEATSKNDVETQKLTGHIPMLLHPRPETVLVIGLGSGMTLGSVISHSPTTADCVEISPDVVEAAQRYFREYNRDCLAHPSTRMIIGDGRNHVILTDQRYDVIISQPSNPWIAGLGELFTHEFWVACRGRLRENGLMCQWLQTYWLSPQTFQLIVRTFQDVFPNMTLWYARSTDLLLIGSAGERPLRIGLRELDERLQQADVQDDLKPTGVQGATAFLSHFIAGPERTRTLASSVTALHTDDNARLEFDMPRQMYTYSPELVVDIDRNCLTDPVTILTEESRASLTASDLARIREIHAMGWERHFRSLIPASMRGAEEDAGLDDPGVLLARFETVYQAARESYERRQYTEARKELERLIALHHRIAELERSGPDWAKENLKTVGPLNALFARSAANLGILLVTGQDRSISRSDAIDKAIAAFEACIRWDPEMTQAQANLAALLMDRKEYAKAIPLLEKALGKQPANDRLWFALGSALRESGKLTEALDAYRKAVSANPKSEASLVGLGRTWEQLGDLKQATEAYKSALQLNPANREASARLEALRKKEAPGEENPGGEPR